MTQNERALLTVTAGAIAALMEHLSLTDGSFRPNGTMHKAYKVLEEAFRQVQAEGQPGSGPKLGD